MIEHPLGVHFGLPDVDYHSDPALGSTDIKKLLASPADYYWESQWNPLREERHETASQVWGSAFHKLILEGRPAFERAYIIEPHKGDPEYKGRAILDTIDDLKAWLATHSLRATGSKADLIAKVEDAVVTLRGDLQPPVVWAREIERFKSALERDGRIPLSRQTYHEILLSEGMIVKNPALKEAFSGGHPEVSVFWEERGVRMKARLDYVKPTATVDLKSFRRQRGGGTLERAVMNAVAQFRYDLQAAHYVIGRQHFSDHVLSGRVYGTPPDEHWLIEAASYPDVPFVWVFYQAEGAPVARGWTAGRGVIEAAAGQRQLAISAYKENLERFGVDLWVDMSPIMSVDAEDLPPWMGM